MKKSKIMTALFLIVMTLMTCSMTACNTTKSETVSTDQDVNLRQMQAICEFATLECFYHNTAKYSSDKSVLWWNTNKELWVEYTGIVKVGVDLTNLDMSIDGNIVTITIPDAKILSCDVNESSLNNDSYISKSTGLFAEKITAKDQTAAFKDAQAKMLETAGADSALMAQAQQRAQELLEKYVTNVGTVIGKNYEVKWQKAIVNK